MTSARGSGEHPGRENATSWTPVLSWEGPLDPLVHALAQIPDDLRLQVESTQSNFTRLELLASAYGVRDRLDFVRQKGSTPRAAVLRSSPLTSDGSLLRSNASGSMAELVESLRRPDDPPATQRDSDVVLEGQRIVIITNLATHYRVPLFNSLSERCVSAGAELRVMLLARRATTRPWMKPGVVAFDHVYLSGLDISRDRGRRIVPLNLKAELDTFSPTMIISGSLSPLVTERVARYARRRGLPSAVWSGEIPTRAATLSKVRHWQRRRLIRKIDFALAYGSESSRYLRSLRDELPLVLARNTTLIPPMRVRPAQPALIEVLTVARAERSKALDISIRAFRRLENDHCRLTIIGDGPELPLLRRLATGDERVRFLGAIPSDQVLQSFSDSDVFLFPSRDDIFGLALVEAMGAGLATIVSPRPGAVADICVSGVNSLIVAVDDVDEWASALSRVIENHELRLSLGAAAARTIRSRWTIDHAADAMLAGIRLGALIGRNGAR
jgi:glycosyltransferase involved in cell wall biosynthesis